jgi:hypothetical protein
LLDTKRIGNTVVSENLLSVVFTPTKPVVLTFIGNSHTSKKGKVKVNQSLVRLGETLRLPGTLGS